MPVVSTSIDQSEPHLLQRHTADRIGFIELLP